MSLSQSHDQEGSILDDHKKTSILDTPLTVRVNLFIEMTRIHLGASSLVTDLDADIPGDDQPTR